MLSYKYKHILKKYEFSVMKAFLSCRARRIQCIESFTIGSKRQKKLTRKIQKNSHNDFSWFSHFFWIFYENSFMLVFTVILSLLLLFMVFIFFFLFFSFYFHVRQPKYTKFSKIKLINTAERDAGKDQIRTFFNLTNSNLNAFGFIYFLYFLICVCFEIEVHFCGRFLKTFLDFFWNSHDGFWKLGGDWLKKIFISWGI